MVVKASSSDIIILMRLSWKLNTSSSVKDENLTPLPKTEVFHFKTNPAIEKSSS